MSAASPTPCTASHVRKPKRPKRSTVSTVMPPTCANDATGNANKNCCAMADSTTHGVPRDTAKCAAAVAAKRESATPTPNGESTTRQSSCNMRATATSPPKYREGPRAAITTVPTSSTSTNGEMVVRLRTTCSNIVNACCSPSAPYCCCHCGNTTAIERVMRAPS